MPNQLRHVLSVAVAALGLAACSFSVGTSGLDMDKIEEEITDGIETQTDATVESIDCPESRDIEEGDTFTCDVELDTGETVIVDVEQSDADGNIVWNVRESGGSDDGDNGGDTSGGDSGDGGLDMDALEAEIQTGIESQTGAGVVDVECPDSRPMEAGDTFTCDAELETGEVATVGVTQDDDQGNVSWSLQ